MHAGLDERWIDFDVGRGHHVSREELFQIEDVPGLVCRNCGEQWVEDEVRENIEKIMAENTGADPHVQ